MTLWDVLTVGSGAAAFGGAMSAAQLARRIGSMQFVVAVVAAFLIAASCTGVIRAAGGIVFRRLFAASSKEQAARAWLVDLAARAMYFFAAAWCLVCLFLGYWMTALFVDCCLR
jgi:hypothetical protein